MVMFQSPEATALARRVYDDARKRHVGDEVRASRKARADRDAALYIARQMAWSYRDERAQTTPKQWKDLLEALGE